MANDNDNGNDSDVEVVDATGEVPEYIPEGDLVIPAEEAPSGHGGTGPAPLPHPLTEEANKPERAGEISETPEPQE